jgi:hypothetical protein
VNSNTFLPGSNSGEAGNLIYMFLYEQPLLWDKQISPIHYPFPLHNLPAPVSSNLFEGHPQ